MAVITTGNPVVINSTGTLTGTHNVRLIQWIDDAEDIGDGDIMVLVINGVTLTVTIQKDATGVHPAVAWQIGPFNPGIPMTDITATIDTGVIHIWR